MERPRHFFLQGQIFRQTSRANLSKITRPCHSQHPSPFNFIFQPSKYHPPTQQVFMLCIYLPTPRLNYLPPQKRQLQGADFQPLLHPQCLRVHRVYTHLLYSHPADVSEELSAQLRHSAVWRPSPDFLEGLRPTSWGTPNSQSCCGMSPVNLGDTLICTYG